MRLSRALLAEALSDLGASIGFSALTLEMARTGEAFWVELFAALGYLALGPLLLFSPHLEGRGLARVLLELRLARSLLFLPLLLLPREPGLLVLYAYPLMILTDLAVVAWEAWWASASAPSSSPSTPPSLTSFPPASSSWPGSSSAMPSLGRNKRRGNKNKKRNPRAWAGLLAASWPTSP
jgi:hypothetical protein